MSIHELGWDKWIIKPQIIDFGDCEGSCPARRKCLPSTYKKLDVFHVADKYVAYHKENAITVVDKCGCQY